MTSKVHSPKIIEAPDTFYLGARISPDDRNTLIEPVYYDSADLTTHAVLLGMTGSGKTGLAIDVVEEAALDGIPQLIIDPKGDMTNLMLSFQELTGDTAKHWANIQSNGSVDKDSIDPEAMAEEWSSKLKLWGIDPSRIRRFRESANFNIFTPGTDAGIPISVLASFQAPQDGWTGQEDKQRQKLSGIVTAILSLIGVDAKPLEDPEHILLANIFEYNWSQGLDLTVEHLIHQVQDPPFNKLGVLDVDSVISSKARQNLAQQLNNIIAAPTFQSWLEGQPLNIPSLLFGEDGSPRTSIFYLAHLEESERQFFITLLLESVLAWMHTLTGAPKLRSLIYIDEVYGLFPPAPHNPPTKDPIMRLLKQARALGVGLIMATQNTKDIDYKGLSNAGTWFIGKLLTDHDRKRVLKGIDTKDSSDERKLDLNTIQELLGDLNTREFIRYNIHDHEKVILMKSRQTMSYLRGPLNVAQISQLMEGKRKSFASAPRHGRTAEASRQVMSIRKQALKTFSGSRIKSGVDERPVQPLTRADAPAGFAPVKPDISDAIDQYYLPVEFTPGQTIFNWRRQQGLDSEMVQESGKLLYQAGLLGEVNVRYSHSKTNSSRQLWYAFIMPTLPDMIVTDWGPYLDDPFDPDSLSQQPYSDAYYGGVPRSLQLKSDFDELEDRMNDWIYKNLPIYTYHNPDLDLYRGLQEDPDSFFARLQAEVRENRDQEISKLVDEYDRQYDSLEKQIQRKRSRLDAEEEELESRHEEEIISGAESAWRLLRGSVYRTISRIAQLRRQSSQTDENIEVLNEDLSQLLEEVDETEQEMENDLNAVREKWKRISQNVEEVPVTAYKKDITSILFGIVWVPYWVIEMRESQFILPATSSTIGEQQGLIQASESSRLR